MERVLDCLQRFLAVCEEPLPEPGELSGSDEATSSAAVVAAYYAAAEAKFLCADYVAKNVAPTPLNSGEQSCADAASVVSEEDEGDGEDGYCYAMLLSAEGFQFAGRPSVSALGPRPSFGALLDAPATWFDPNPMCCVVKERGVYHVSTSGLVSARECLAAVARKSQCAFPDGSLGQSLLQEKVSAVLLQKSPSLDVRLGALSSEVPGPRMRCPYNLDFQDGGRTSAAVIAAAQSVEVSLGDVPGVHYTAFNGVVRLWLTEAGANRLLPGCTPSEVHAVDGRRFASFVVSLLAESAGSEEFLLPYGLCYLNLFEKEDWVQFASALGLMPLIKSALSEKVAFAKCRLHYSEGGVWHVEPPGDESVSCFRWDTLVSGTAEAQSHRQYAGVLTPTEMLDGCLAGLGGENGESKAHSKSSVVDWSEDLLEVMKAARKEKVLGRKFLLATTHSFLPEPMAATSSSNTKTLVIAPGVLQDRADERHPRSVIWFLPPGFSFGFDVGGHSYEFPLGCGGEHIAALRTLSNVPLRVRNCLGKAEPVVVRRLAGRDYLSEVFDAEDFFIAAHSPFSVDPSAGLCAPYSEDDFFGKVSSFEMGNGCNVSEFRVSLVAGVSKSIKLRLDPQDRNSVLMVLGGSVLVRTGGATVWVGSGSLPAFPRPQVEPKVGREGLGLSTDTGAGEFTFWSGEKRELTFYLVSVRDAEKYDSTLTSLERVGGIVAVVNGPFRTFF